jgi:endonuclease/exonuclease/phosphatase family metal-dependent hydrolase
VNISTATNTFRIASYNVKNLFDNIDDPDKADEKTPAKPAVEQKALAAVIDASEADVLSLQEVENLSVLTEFRDKHGLAEEYPHLVLVEGNDNRGIDVALMSKYPITNVKSHKDEVFEIPGQEPRGFLRDLLQADIEIPQYGPVRFFSAHLASKIGGERSDVMREAEATAARAIIKEEVRDFPGQKYVVMGDFNDTPDSKSVQKLLQKDSDNWGLVDGFRGEPEAVSYPTSEKTARKWGYKRIDQILLSPEMAATQVDESVHKHPRSEVASDHWMVTADFQLKTA